MRIGAEGVVVTAEREERAVPGEERGVWLARRLGPVQPRPLERGGILRVGQGPAIGDEVAELRLASGTDRLGQPGVDMVGEVQEGRRCAPLLAREEQGQVRSQQHQAGGDTRS